jgi:hypothetical protein
LAFAFLIKPAKTARHPERSCSRHFVSNAVEWTPVFAFAFAIAVAIAFAFAVAVPLQLQLSLVCHPAGICRCSSPPTQTYVISTEPTHSFIVSSAAERSLYFVFAFACSD